MTTLQRTLTSFGQTNIREVQLRAICADVVAWLDYWFERFGGQGAALEGPLAADYDELQQRMAQT